MRHSQGAATLSRLGRGLLPLEIRGIRASTREPMAASGFMAAAAGVIGLITWSRNDDQRRRSLLTMRPRAAFTASQLVTERDRPGWHGHSRFHAERRLGARSRRVKRCGLPRQNIWFWARLRGLACASSHVVLLQRRGLRVCRLRRCCAVGGSPCTEQHGIGKDCLVHLQLVFHPLRKRFCAYLLGGGDAGALDQRRCGANDPG